MKVSYNLTEINCFFSSEKWSLQKRTPTTKPNSTNINHDKRWDYVQKYRISYLNLPLHNNTVIQNKREALEYLKKPTTDERRVECYRAICERVLFPGFEQQKMYCTCSLNNQWMHHNSHQNMTTALPPTANGCTDINSSNLKYSPHHNAMRPNQHMIPWRYCTCKNTCYYCTFNTPSWLPHCPRQSTSQPALNISCTNGDCKHGAQFANNMMGQPSSPALSASPPPAPIPQPPNYHRTSSVGLCSRCRFAIPPTRHDMNDDEHHHLHPGGQPINFGMGPNTYTGEFVVLSHCMHSKTNRLQFWRHLCMFP